MNNYGEELMTIKCIATGSKGNCYILKSKFGKELIVECGIKYENILLNIENQNNVEGVLISHNHTDHNAKVGKLRVSDFMRNNLYEVYETTNCEVGKRYCLGDFSFIPLPAKHNVDCYSYYIEVDGLKILFATDTQVIPRINTICDYYMVEVNYDMDLLDNELDKMLTDSQEEIPLHIGSVYQNHSGLQTVEDYFEYNLKGKKPKGIFTIHASRSGLLNESVVYERLLKFCDNVIVVEGGMTIEC